MGPGILRSPIAIIQGVGPGTGSSIARTFAKHYPVVLLSRHASSYDPVIEEIHNAGGQAIGIETDVTDETSIGQAFTKIEGLVDEGKGQFKVAAAILNGFGGHGIKGFLDIGFEEFRKGMDTPGYGSFLFSKHVLPGLLRYASELKDNSTSALPSPTLIFTGSTASLRGSLGFASFAAGRFAVRALNQSLAREFAPKGIHVAHLVIDGLVDTAQTKGLAEGESTKVQPDAVRYALSTWSDKIANHYLLDCGDLLALASAAQVELDTGDGP